mgnify:CR=1 FL=1
MGIKVGETTPDRQFTLETVACIGCCALAPAVRVNEDTYGRLIPDNVPKILKNYTQA